MLSPLFWCTWMAITVKKVYACMAITFNREWINRVRLSILLVVSRTEKIKNSLSPFAPETLVSQDEFDRLVPSAYSFSILSQAESGAYSRDNSQSPRRGVHSYFYCHTRSGQSRVYRVKQLHTDGVLPRVRRHRASSPQGSSSNGCCLCITIDQQLMYASRFPHHLLLV